MQAAETLYAELRRALGSQCAAQRQWPPTYVHDLCSDDALMNERLARILVFLPLVHLADKGFLVVDLLSTCSCGALLLVESTLSTV